MSFVEDYNKELYHYGVKGMKWGVRRAKRYVDTSITKANRKINAARWGKEDADKNIDDLHKNRVKSKAMKRLYGIDEQGTLPGKQYWKDLGTTPQKEVKAMIEDYEHSKKGFDNVERVYQKGKDYLQSVDVSSMSVKEIRNNYKDVIRQGKKQVSSWVYV